MYYPQTSSSQTEWKSFRDTVEDTVMPQESREIKEMKVLKLQERTLIFSSVQFSGSVVSSSLQPHGLQHAKPPYPSPTPGVYSNSCPLSQGCHSTISSLCCSPSPLPLILHSIRVFSNESVLHIRWPKLWSFSFSISPLNKYSGLISFRLTIGSPCSPRDSQESSPTPQFKSINSSVISFLYSLTLISIHDYWKNHSFDYTGFCLICYLGLA